jgi:hypothetical protein
MIRLEDERTPRRPAAPRGWANHFNITDWNGSVKEISGGGFAFRSAAASLAGIDGTIGFARFGFCSG